MYNIIFLLLYTLQLEKWRKELPYDLVVALLDVYPKNTKHVQSVTVSPTAPGASVLVGPRLLFLDDGHRLPVGLPLSARASLQKEGSQVEVRVHHFSAEKSLMAPHPTQSQSQVPTVLGPQLLLWFHIWPLSPLLIFFLSDLVAPQPVPAHHPRPTRAGTLSSSVWTSFPQQSARIIPFPVQLWREW